MPLVILFYLLANVAYILVLPRHIIATSTTVAVSFGHTVFGSLGSLSLALIVCASCFGALNAATFTSGRLIYAAGKEGFLPEVLGRIGMPGTIEVGNRIRQRGWMSTKLRKVIGDDDGGLGFTPINAMVMNALLCTAYIIIGEFGTLITFYSVAGYTFYFLTVLGLIVLRVREPNLERPYRTWISTPIIFCCVSLFLLSRAVFAQPIQTLIVVGFVGAGVPVYILKAGGGKRSRWKDEVNGGGWRFWKRWRKG